MANQYCDRCHIARAVGATLHEAGPLYWCGHHLRKYAAALADHTLYPINTDTTDDHTPTVVIQA